MGSLPSLLPPTASKQFPELALESVKAAAAELEKRKSCSETGSSDRPIFKRTLEVDAMTDR
jgi:hypothetical protein